MVGVEEKSGVSSLLSPRDRRKRAAAGRAGLQRDRRAPAEADYAEFAAAARAQRLDGLALC